MKRLGWFLLLVLLCTVGSRSAWACTCIPPQPPETALAQASNVFAGKVLSIKDIGDGNWEVTLTLERHFKGEKPTRVRLRTANNTAACGFPFEKGTYYLVYTDTWEGELWASLCSRTRRLAEADEDLEAFDAAGWKPGRTGCGGDDIVAVQVGFFVLFGLLFLRLTPRRL